MNIDVHVLTDGQASKYCRLFDFRSWPGLFSQFLATISVPLMIMIEQLSLCSFACNEKEALFTKEPIAWALNLNP